VTVLAFMPKQSSQRGLDHANHAAREAQGSDTLGRQSGANMLPADRRGRVNMSIELRIDYGNSVEKIFHNLPYKAVTIPTQPNGVVHVHDVLQQAADIMPGIHYEFEPQWLGGNEGATNRAGWIPFFVAEIDGVKGPWQVLVSGSPVELRKQMAGLSILPEQSGVLADGDVVTLIAGTEESC
jgi:hypothetical protein